VLPAAAAARKQLRRELKCTTKSTWRLARLPDATREKIVRKYKGLRETHVIFVGNGRMMMM